MARCVIVSACPVDAALKKLLRPGDTIVACDAGYRNCEALGLRPDIILGDFDSAPRPSRADCIVLPHVKDDTDTHYAAKLAVQKGFDEVLLLGTIGGKRLEHTLANLSTGLWLARQGIRVTLQNEYSRITYLCAGGSRSYPKETYSYLSVLPAGGAACGITITGAAYPLRDAQLTDTMLSLGTSNEYAPGSEEIIVSVKKGDLLLVETREDRNLFSIAGI